MNKEYKELIERTSLIAAIACGELSPELLKLAQEQLDDLSKDSIDQEILPIVQQPTNY
jgi:hypothetical protein